ncbi:MAG: 2,3-bisphosphoglycerate-dependent phosphoglycerate mutase (phosphoglyceromutase) (pgam) [Candidatus Saccharibacteria bacterium]|jgi:2,3-bisphosphoglycerate-dependent phosphoglycerate mutase|nr:2,3-bisphosphoglycerate-dependent phosphoglycerate mutase (phosphoglyceromutase) (pgam) [Candidatus Saccharibacteria bacterium]
MAYLVLVRHGQSAWNELGQWTGLTDVELTEKGRQEARAAAKALEDITFHSAHTSRLKRAQDTLSEILDELGQTELEAKKAAAINERDYGKLTGKNKWQVKEELGEEEFTKIRRSWDHPVPGGETLKDVHDRAVPYYKEHILADLRAGKNVIVSAHGNSLRALVKHIENVAPEEIPGLEIGTGEVYLYEIEPENGRIVAKEIRTTGGKA